MSLANGDQVKVLAQIIMDWADNNLTNWEAFADETPVGAKDIYEKAKALNDILNKE